MGGSFLSLTTLSLTTLSLSDDDDAIVLSTTQVAIDGERWPRR